MIIKSIYDREGSIKMNILSLLVEYYLYAFEVLVISGFCAVVILNILREVM